MTKRLIDKIFAKKIKGEELTNLFGALGGVDHLPKELLNYDGPYINVRSYGKLYVQPSKEGLNFDLEILVKEKNYYCSPDELTPQIIGTPKVTKRTFQIKKTIPYSELQKLNLGNLKQ